MRYRPLGYQTLLRHFKEHSPFTERSLAIPPLMDIEFSNYLDRIAFRLYDEDVGIAIFKQGSGWDHQSYQVIIRTLAIFVKLGLA